jgi:transcriptional regulator of acetoin/glycerol metabolism
MALPEGASRSHRTVLEDAEREQIVRALAESDGNRLEAARALGIHKTTLFRKVRKLGIVLPRRDGRSRRRKGDQKDSTA